MKMTIGNDAYEVRGWDIFITKSSYMDGVPKKIGELEHYEGDSNGYRDTLRMIEVVFDFYREWVIRRGHNKIIEGTG